MKARGGRDGSRKEPDLPSGSFQDSEQLQLPVGLGLKGSLTVYLAGVASAEARR